MDLKEIQDRISKHSKRIQEINIQRRYAGGNHPSIIDRPAHEEPDSRIPIPIPRKAIRFVSGYMAKPGNIVYTCEDPEEYVDDILKPIFDQNDEELTTQEELETALAHGEAWEYHYTEENEPRFVEIPIERCIPIWDKSLPPKLVGFIDYYIDSDSVRHIRYFDDSTIYSWEGKNDSELTKLADELHGYGEVPFAQLKMSRDCSNLFDHAKQLIDHYDRLISEDYANELQRFANAYLLLAERLSNEVDENGQTEIDKLKNTRTFEGLGKADGTGSVSDRVQFLIKQINDGFIEHSADRFERLIYEMIQIINPNDNEFATADSGVAMAYKLLQMEYLIASIECYISRGLQKRIRLIQNISGNMSASDQDRPQVTITFRRNLPFDMASAVDQFVKVYGMLPDDLALKLFPANFIPDVDKVLDDMEEQRKVKIEEAQDAMGNSPDASRDSSESSDNDA